ncbi:MAG: hypothetical protein M1821_004123 [Bathelium mastoideum]|nr:MAG: hypothetical protein M1821_004123 [Bathelium mastoideum]
MSFKWSTASKSDKSNKMVFIAFHVGGWVVQYALTRLTMDTTEQREIAHHTVGCIFYKFTSVSQGQISHGHSVRSLLSKYGSRTSSSDLAKTLIAQFYQLVKQLEERECRFVLIGLGVDDRGGRMQEAQPVRNPNSFKSSEILHKPRKISSYDKSEVNSLLGKSPIDEILENLSSAKSTSLPFKPDQEFEPPCHTSSTQGPLCQPADTQLDHDYSNAQSKSTMPAPRNFHDSMRPWPESGLPNKPAVHGALHTLDGQSQEDDQDDIAHKSSFTSVAGAVKTHSGEFTTDAKARKATKGDIDRLNAAAQSLCEGGELDQAKQCYFEILRLYKAIDPQESKFARELIEIGKEIGVIELQKGKLDLAEKILKRHLEACRHTTPINSDLAMEIERWLATVFNNRGDSRFALDFIEKAKSRVHEIIFRNPEATKKVKRLQQALSLIESLALINHCKFKKALEVGRDVLEYWEKELAHHEKQTNVFLASVGVETLRDIRMNVAEARWTLARLLTTLEDYQSTWVENEKALFIMKQELGERHTRTLKSLGLRSQLLAENDSLLAAERQCLETVNFMRLHLGDEHPSTLTHMCTLYSIFRRQGQSVRAERRFADLQREYELKDDLSKSRPQMFEAWNQLFRSANCTWTTQRCRGKPDTTSE